MANKTGSENQAPELLPCPLCESPDLLLRDCAGWELDCRGCELSLVLADDPSREGLITRWNTRPDLCAQSGELTAEQCLAELREISGSYPQIIIDLRDCGSETNEQGRIEYTIQIGANGQDFTGTTLADCMAQVRAWKGSDHNDQVD